MDLAAAHSPQFALAPLRCEFCCAATEDAFLRQHLATMQAQLRMTFICCAVFFVGFAVCDAAWLGLVPALLVLLAARLAVAAIALIGIAVVRRHPLSIRLARAVASVGELAGCAGFLLIVLLRPQPMALHAITMSIVLIVLYMYIPNRLIHAAAIAAATTALFLVLARGVGRLPGAELGTMTLLLTLANLFGYIAARRHQLLWREQFSAQTVLKNLSIRDHLTGCYNRRHLHAQLLETEIARAQRYSQSLTVIMCDLDHFKDVNDRYGHYGGDAVLQVFAGLLQSMTRDSVDSVVRYGGEEFLLILPETDLGGGVLLAERLRLAFAAAPIEHERQAIDATASFGVVSVDFSGVVSAAAQQRMIACADELLYAAKKAGRNRVCSRQLR
ncbi:diguanylate cyclase [Rugamonas sp.]|uniref:GGDEF domain-containing protein n=1 Tax=Rugamonas sp. TaxID=1926287 RepID=UPI0025F1DA8A|nr:GGDEF domain-containing protein [Rugamonas sp.]